MQDTWSSRDLPVLDAVVSMLDEPNRNFVAVHQIAARTGLDKMEVARALDALEGPYVIKYQKLAGSDPANWHGGKVTRRLCRSAPRSATRLRDIHAFPTHAARESTRIQTTPLSSPKRH